MKKNNNKQNNNNENIKINKYKKEDKYPIEYID